jgi:hypothetical protein
MILLRRLTYAFIAHQNGFLQRVFLQERSANSRQLESAKPILALFQVDPAYLTGGSQFLYKSLDKIVTFGQLSTPVCITMRFALIATALAGIATFANAQQPPIPGTYFIVNSVPSPAGDRLAAAFQDGQKDVTVTPLTGSEVQRVSF